MKNMGKILIPLMIGAGSGVAMFMFTKKRKKFTDRLLDEVNESLKDLE